MSGIHRQRWGGLMLWLVWLNGCMSTTATWKHAGNRELRSEYIKGVLLDRSVNPPGIRALVAGYVVGESGPPNLVGEGDFFPVVIALDEKGSPIWPFCGDETLRDPRAIWANLPADQRRELASVHFAEQDFAAAKKAMASPDFVAIGQSPEGISSHRGSSYTAGGRAPGGQEISVSWYWPTRDSPTTAPERGYLGPTRYPPTSHVLVLPLTQPRPDLDRAANIVGAVLATPVAVAVDAFILDPMLIYLQVTHTPW